MNIVNFWSFSNNNSHGTNKFHGLINQGATCYLNSVLQVLFMTKDFREAVAKFTNENPHTELIDHHLEALFEDLQKDKARTDKIIKNLDIDNVYEQRDAAEYFERVLGLTSPEASKIFHGLLANKTSCSKCLTETYSDAPFWHLPLSLVDSCSENYSVANGIDKFFRPSFLCGENQMYCDQCDDKVDATLADVIKHHPDVLILLLKRFEFNYYYMSYVKINCSVEVPYSLQMPESQTYELYAVVDHFGDLRGGHYTARIKIQEEHEDRWYKFDDIRVTLLDKQMSQENNTERSETAYLLFYRKKKDTGTQDFRDVSTSGSSQFATNDDHECQHVENKRKRDMDEDTAENSNDTVKVICIDKDKEKEFTEITSDSSRGAEVSTHLCSNVDHQDKQIYEDTWGNGGNGSNDLDHKLKEIIQDHENTGVYDADVRQSRPNNNDDFTPEVSDRLAVCDHVNKQDEMRYAKRKSMDEKTGEDGKTDDKQSEKKNHVEPPEDKKLDNSKQIIYEHQGGKQNTGKEYSCSPARGDKEDNVKRMKPDFQDHTNGKIGTDRSTTRMCCDTFQDNEKGYRKENITEDQRHKQEKEHSDHNDILNIQEISDKHSTDEYVCVEGQTRKVEDRRGKKEDKPLQKRKNTMEKCDHSEGVENEDMRRLDELGQITAEKISDASTTQKDVDVEKATKEQENKGDPEQIQTRKNSSQRSVGLQRGERPTVNQGAGNNEKNRAKCSQPKARTGNQGIADGGRDSQKSEIQVKIPEKCRQTPDGESSEMNIRTVTVAQTPQSSFERSKKVNDRNIKRKSDQTKDTMDNLSTGVDRLKVNESTLQEKQKQTRTKRKIQKDDERIYSKAAKIQKLADEEKEVAVKKRNKNRWLFFRLRRNKQKKDQHSNKFAKQKKTTGCFSFSCKNAGQDSDLD